MMKEYEGDKLGLPHFDSGAMTGPSQPAWEAFKSEKKVVQEVLPRQ